MNFFIGLIIIAVGAVMIGRYQQISHSFMGGAAGYEKVKLWGIIVCVIGFVFMFSLHTVFLNLIFGPIFGK